MPSLHWKNGSEQGKLVDAALGVAEISSSDWWAILV